MTQDQDPRDPLADPAPPDISGPPDPPAPDGGDPSGDPGEGEGHAVAVEDDRGAQGDAGVEGLPPFSPDLFFREMRLDAWLRWSVAGAVIVAVGFLIVSGLADTFAGMVLAMLLILGWVAVSSISAGVFRALPGLTAMIGQDPSAAESALAQQIRRRPLMRWVRLMLYHRLASIRHRQQRFAESAAICQAVLTQPLGPASAQRGRLLLMLTEARLQCRDLYGAYRSLCELHHQRLGLVESLQRLAIQTRYEVLAGHDRAALSNTRQKLLMAELMPPVHCGAMHAMLTTAAARTGQDELADWLWRRSLLLCGAQQLDRLVKGAFAVGFVGPPESGNLPNG